MTMLSKQKKRILDVNRNRITEGLRVAEDFLRFSKGFMRYSKKIKQLRHRAFKIFEIIEEDTGRLVLSRRPGSVTGPHW